MSDTTSSSDDVLVAVKVKYDFLKGNVDAAKTALATAELALETFRTSTMAVLDVASAHKSGQAQRAERQARVAQLLEEGMIRAEIVRRTGLPDHLVGYDIDCIRRRKLKGSGDKRHVPEPPLAAPATFEELTDDAGAPSEDVSEETSQEDLDEIPADKSEKAATSSEEIEDENVEDDGEDDDVPGATLKALLAESLVRHEKTKGIVLFKTTSDGGHSHVASLSPDGYGRTDEVEDHSHVVYAFDVRETEDHAHGLTLEPAPGPEPKPAPEPVKKNEPSPYAAKGSSKPGEVKSGCSLSREGLKKLAKDFRRGQRKTLTFVTTQDKGQGPAHHHVAVLDAMGDGETRKNDGTGHFHRVCRFELIEGSHDHTHGLTSEEEKP
jgi:hypothetical protein